MKFIVSSSLLLKNLQLVGGVLGSNKNAMIPILDDFLIELKDKTLKITASDLSNTMTTEMIVDMGEGEGAIAIPGKKLMDMLKTFSDIPISFEINLENGAVEISAGDGRYRMAGHKADDFPVLPEFEDIKSIKINNDNLQTAIAKTLFAVSNEELRPTLTGVLFDIYKDKIVFVSTDAHKLVKYTISELKNSDEFKFIVSKKALNLLKGLGQEEEEVLVEFNENLVAFTFGDAKLYSRLISGEFPDYNIIIPQNNNNILTIEKDMFITTLRRVSFFADQSSSQISLTIAGQELVIAAEDREYENEAKERLACSYDGSDIVIGFNSRFLIDMLTHIDEEQIRMELSEPTRAVVILPEVGDEKTNEDLFMLISPLMLKN